MIRYAIQISCLYFLTLFTMSKVSHTEGHRTVMKSHLLDQVFHTAIKSMLANVLQYRKKEKEKLLPSATQTVHSRSHTIFAGNLILETLQGTSSIDSAHHCVRFSSAKNCEKCRKPLAPKGSRNTAWEIKGLLDVPPIRNFAKQKKKSQSGAPAMPEFEPALPLKVNAVTCP